MSTQEPTIPTRLPASPALCIDRELLDVNINATLSMVDSPARLWPHIKTYKSSRLIMRLQARGVRRFKCATPAEAQLLGRCGVETALLAYPVTGPTLPAAVAIAARYRQTRFALLVEDIPRVAEIEESCRNARVTVDLFVDVDSGQRRTGLSSVDEAARLVSRIRGSDQVGFGGLHLYDGHNHQLERADRVRGVEAAVAIADAVQRRLPGGPAETIIAGGTPTFPLYAEMTSWALSPGTAFLYDAGYDRRFPDLPFTPAAWVVGQVVSVPGDRRITLDIGTKALATDPHGARGVFPELDVDEVLIHNEEHWVLSLKRMPEHLAIGTPVRVIPTHICPTVNLYNRVFLTDRTKGIIETWPIDGRDRVL